MKFDVLSYFFTGYLTVCADGPFTERLINICLHRNINIFNIKRCGSNRIVFDIELKSFYNIRLPAKRTKSHIKILKRNGIPFILKKYKKRKPILLGAIITLAILWYTSNHVIGITVFGNNRIETNHIKNTLKECGLSVGTKTSSVKPDILRNRLMIRLPELAWVGINANGSRVYIEVVERIETESGVDKNAPMCDLVASKDGEIERIEVRNGQTVCKIGSGVRKGDVLVSGIVNNSANGFEYVRARGEVYAKTSYRITRSYSLNYRNENYTGRSKSKYILTIKSKNLPLYIFSEIPYEEFKFSEKKKEYKIPNNIIPSFFITERKYEEISTEIKNIKPEEVEEVFGKELLDELKTQINESAIVIKEEVSYTLNEKNEAEVTAEILCSENIAEEFLIEYSERP